LKETDAALISSLAIGFELTRRNKRNLNVIDLKSMISSNNSSRHRCVNKSKLRNFCISLSESKTSFSEFSPIRN
jgi:hypothetical protein